VVGVAHELAPELEGFPGLAGPEACVFKSGEDRAAARREPRKP
jgi:hypothetical protein